MKEMLVPLPWHGSSTDVPHTEVQWLKQMPNNTYCALWQRWPDKDLPLGYDQYVVSFHLEVIDVEWINKQTKNIQAPIIVLSDSNVYDYNFANNVHCYTYYYWHHQLKKMQDWHGHQTPVEKTYKFSAVCNRITQSKIWITTKLLENAQDTSLIILSDWLEEKNVHNWQLTGRPKLDDLTIAFKEKYHGQSIKIDEFDNATMNFQTITSNPWQPIYTQAAVHFTNESFHYSYMVDDQHYIYPGPFITEKSLKCLVGATAMIPVGQFETYHTLARLGLCFDYPFDISWDQDSSNLSRAESIVNLIDHLNQYSVQELSSMTQSINLYNQNYIISGQFYQRCEQHNNQAIEQIIQDL